MIKIPCLFVREFHDKRSFTLTRDVTPGCEWVIAGEGRATRKWDGTAVSIIDGRAYARYDAKHGKPAPAGAIACGDPDPVTGHWPHWVLADRPQDVWIRAAVASVPAGLFDGTYEAVGPKIGGNAEGLASQHLMPHGGVLDELNPVRSWDGLRDFLVQRNMEGIVFHHGDGRMAKIRRDDYGFPWPMSAEMKGA